MNNEKTLQKKKTIDIILKVIQYIIFAILVIFIISNVVMRIKAARGEKVPTFLGFGNAVIETGSMTPTIKVGDIIVFHHESHYKVGEVITFDQEGYDKPITHRIIAVSVNSNGEECYRTKGDYQYNSPDQDEGEVEKYIAYSAVHGKVILTLHNGEAIIDFIKSPAGILIIILIIAAIYITPVIIKAIKENKRG